MSPRPSERPGARSAPRGTTGRPTASARAGGTARGARPTPGVLPAKGRLPAKSNANPPRPGTRTAAPRRPAPAARRPAPRPSRFRKAGRPEKRLRWVAALVALVLVAFVLRLAYVQLYDGPALAARGQHQRLTTAELPATRGDITDSKGVVLATSQTRYTLLANPKNVAAFVPTDAQVAAYRGTGELGTGAVAAAKLIAPWSTRTRARSAPHSTRRRRGSSCSTRSSPRTCCRRPGGRSTRLGSRASRPSRRRSVSTRRARPAGTSWATSTRDSRARAASRRSSTPSSPARPARRPTNGASTGSGSPRGRTRTRPRCPAPTSP
nr:hypothetical protein [Luteimicrobium album]